MYNTTIFGIKKYIKTSLKRFTFLLYIDLTKKENYTIYENYIY